MIRHEKEVVFTEEDKRNLTVKEYTNEEIKNNLKKFNHNHNKKRILLLTILFLLLCIATMATIEPISFTADIGIILVCTILILSETIHRLNRKRVKSRYYIELIVEKKRDVEEYYENSVTTGPDILKFYPIEGRDSTTNYRYICYVDKENYKKTDYGQKIKLSVQRREL